MEGKETLRPGVKWGEQYVIIFPSRAVFIELTNIYRGPDVFHVYSKRPHLTKVLSLNGPVNMCATVHTLWSFLKMRANSP